MTNLTQGIEFFIGALIVFLTFVVIFIDQLFFIGLWEDVNKNPTVTISKGYSEFLLIINSIILGAMVLFFMYFILKASYSNI